MGILGKLAFWKRKEADFNFDSAGDFGAGNNLGMGSGQGYGAGTDQGGNMGFDQGGNEGFGQSDGFGAPGQGGQSNNAFDQANANGGFDSVRDLPGPNYGGQGRAQSDPGIDHKDVQIITSKLDAIKSTLDMLNQRIENLERLANDDKTKEQKRRASW